MRSHLIYVTSILMKFQVHIACQSGRALSVIDRRMGHYPSECIGRFLALALNCCQDEPDARPSVFEVVRELENIRLMSPDAHITPSESLATSSIEAITTQSSVATGGVYLDSNVIHSNLTSIDMPSSAFPR